MTALTSLMGMLWTTTHDEDGQTMAEYGLILAGVAVIVMAAVWALGGAINATFESIVGQF
ncbi:MAG: Flp family type IVb pilin [Dehalococcoidia bacterium]